MESIRLRTELDKLQRQEAKMQRLQSQLAKSTTATANARSRLFDAAGMAMALGAPIKKAIDFESAMSDVRKVVDGLDDPKQFQAMGRAIMDLTTKGRIPMAAEEIAQIVAAAGQAGVARSELVGFARDAAKMGVAFDISAEEAGQSMAKWRTAFGLTQREVVELSDKINYLSNVAGASASKISEVVTRIGPLGKIGGLASGEIAALAASMVSMGIEPEIAATGIKKIITTLNSGKSVTKAQAGAFAQLGIDAGKLAKRMQREAGPAIVDVMQRLNRLPRYQQTAVLKQLFGEEGLAAVGSTAGALDVLQRNLQRVADKTAYAGSVDEEFEKRSKRTADALKVLNNQLEQGAVKVGSVLLPAIADVTSKLGPLIDKFTEWSDKNPQLFGWIVKFGAGAMAFSIAMLAGSYAINLTRSSVLTYVEALQRLKKTKLATAIATKAVAAAQWLWNASLFGCPLLLIIAGVAALAIGIYLLVTNWDKVKVAMSAAWKWFVRFATEGPGRFIPIIGEIGRLIKNWDKVTDAVKRAWDWLKKVWDMAARFGGKVGTAVKGALGIEKHAAGGIVNRPTLSWIGEAGREAVIPLDNHRGQAQALWSDAGRQLGMAGASAGGISVTIHAPITISGNASRADVEAGVAGLEDRIRRVMNQIQTDGRRRSMA